MTPPRLLAGALLACLLTTAAPAAGPPQGKVKLVLPQTGLPPAKLNIEQCLLRYRVTTESQACQDYVDQALGYFYSYVWREAARSFETAILHDPNCALAHWGLARSLKRFGRGNATQALLRAWELREHASDREVMLIKASMQEEGQLPGVGNAEQRKQKATATIDEMLAIYDDDEEAWYYRAQLAGGQGLFGGKASSVPFYKALLKVNPLHPGANHELLHFYENFRRPALGWVYAENYIKSTPGIPHAFHMQAHLATRLGRWDKTSDRSARAIELQRAYHKRENVLPREDSQYQHHLETLLVSLTHDGRFEEGREIVKEAQRAGINLRAPTFRMHLAARDYDAALKLAEEMRAGRAPAKPARGVKGRPPLRSGGDKVSGSYSAALVYLKKGEPARALPEIEVLQNAFRDRKSDRRLELNLLEVQGLYQCATGSAGTGLKLLQKAVDRTKNEYGHHAWGNGAYYMEAWGLGALMGGKLDVAEEAFLEALAHDPGSVRGALGMQVLCEWQGRDEEAVRFETLARKCWSRAQSRHYQAELAALRAAAVLPMPREDATKPGK